MLQALAETGPSCWRWENDRGFLIQQVAAGEDLLYSHINLLHYSPFTATKKFRQLFHIAVKDQRQLFFRQFIHERGKEKHVFKTKADCKLKVNLTRNYHILSHMKCWNIIHLNRSNGWGWITLERNEVLNIFLTNATRPQHSTLHLAGNIPLRTGTFF